MLDKDILVYSYWGVFLQMSLYVWVLQQLISGFLNVNNEL